MRLLRSLAVVVALSLTACQTSQLQTASGKPEVTIFAADASLVKAEIINDMLNSGYVLSRDTAYQLVFDKRMETNFTAQLLLGSNYDQVPAARIAYVISPTNENVRVIADMSIITNPGSAFERRMDMNHSKDATLVQQKLRTVKERAEQKRLKPA